MRNITTMFLRGAVLFLVFITALLCVFVAPILSSGIVREYPSISYVQYPVLVALYLAALSFLVALFWGFKLLRYIDRHEAFSHLSVRALKWIKYSVAAVSGFFALLMPVVYYIADREDAPGLLLFSGIIFVLAPFIIAVFAALLQKLFQSAIDIKTENDLTV